MTGHGLKKQADTVWFVRRKLSVSERQPKKTSRRMCIEALDERAVLSVASLGALGNCSNLEAVAVHSNNLDSGVRIDSLNASVAAASANLHVASTQLVQDQQINFVRGLYLDVLGREPEAGGLAFWVNRLSMGTPTLVVAAGIWESAEHRGIQVTGYYNLFLNRLPDAAGKQFWINQMVSGAKEEQVMAAFMTTTEFMLNHSSNLSFVNALYNDILFRVPDPDGQAFWIDALTSGRLTRPQVVQALLDTHERHLNLVDSYYQHFLKRQPDADGRTFWTNLLDQKVLGDGGVAERLLATPEYFNRPH